MSTIRILGFAAAALGFLVSAFPRWLGPITGGSEPPADLFEAIERRVRGGMLLGLGLCLIAIPSLSPWSTSLPSAIFYLMTGALAARLLGIVVEGPRSWGA